MKRSAPAIWLLLAVVAVGLVILGALFGRGRGAEPARTAASPTDSAPGVEEPRPSSVAAEPELVASEADEQRAPASVAADELTVVRVLDPSGAPRGASGAPEVGARTLLLRGDETLLDEPTDASGEVRVAADSQEALAVVATQSRPTHLADVRLDPGPLDVSLPVGGSVSGLLVRADGERPEGTRLRLESDAALVDVSRLPELVRVELDLATAGQRWLWSEVDADGGFVYSGLPPGWSGVLRAPRGWRVVSTSAGTLAPGASGVRLATPVTGVLVRIAEKPVLRGRVVALENRAPLGGEQLVGLLRSPEGDSHGAGVGTDGDGRFELPLRFERLSSLVLHLGSGDTPPILSLDGAALPADGDLGEIAVDVRRDVPFLVRDEAGGPVYAAHVTAGGLGGDGTDREGRCVVQWIPRSATRAHVEARGYVPTDVELPALILGPVEVTLRTANRLRVALVPPEGGDTDLFRVVVRREAGVTASPVKDRAGQRVHVDEWALPPADLWTAPEHTFLAGKVIPELGYVEFRGLLPGVPLELQVRGITGDAVYHQRTLAPLEPSEERELEVALGEGLLTFQGRVLDAEGRGLARATVQLGGQILDWTDEQGRFTCFVVDDQPRTLVLGHQGYATLFLHDYAPPAGGVPVDFVLQPALSMTVAVVDEAGAPMPQAEVWILREGFITNTHRVEGHRYLASSLTANPFEVEVRLAGRRYKRAFASPVPETEMVVPVHGSVSAAVPDATTARRAGRFVLVLDPQGEESAAPVRGSRDSSPGLRLELGAVHPGAYAASLRYVPSDEEREAGAEEEESAPVEVRVGAGREAELRLDLPAPG